VHYCPTNRLFSDLVDRWKASVGPSLGKSTFQHYCNALRAYVLPYFKDHQFQAITNEEIQKFINQQAKRYSASSLYGVSGWHDPEAPHLRADLLKPDQTQRMVDRSPARRKPLADAKQRGWILGAILSSAPNG